jgi:hypothetical protein
VWAGIRITDGHEGSYAMAMIESGGEQTTENSRMKNNAERDIIHDVREHDLVRHRKIHGVSVGRP